MANPIAFFRLPSASGPSSTSGGTGKKLLSMKLKPNSAVVEWGWWAKPSTQSYSRRCRCHHGTARAASASFTTAAPSSGPGVSRMGAPFPPAAAPRAPSGRTPKQ